MEKKFGEALWNVTMCKSQSAWWKHLAVLEKQDTKKVVLTLNNFIFRIWLCIQYTTIVFSLCIHFSLVWSGKAQKWLQSLWSCCEGWKWYPRFTGNAEKRRRKNLFYLFFSFVLQKKKIFGFFLMCKGLQISEPSRLYLFCGGLFLSSFDDLEDVLVVDWNKI